MAETGVDVISADHEELRRTVRSLLDRHSPESEVRRVMATERGQEPELWSRLAGAGLLALPVPEEHDGGGYGWVEAGVVAGETGRALACVPFLSSSVLATATLLYCADDTARKEYLPALGAGSATATLALTNHGAGWGAHGDGVAATRERSEWRLDGHHGFVLDGHTADLLLVVAWIGGGPEVGVFAVDSGAENLTRTALSTLDQTRKLARLDFNAVKARLVGQPTQAGAGLRRVMSLAGVLLAAEQLGGAERALEMAVDYARVRHQFGRPIGSFQAVKHLCADMLVDVEFARSAVHHALWAADHDPAELPVAAALAQAYCSDAYVRVAGHNIQVHGGIGFTWEHPAHLYLKRAKSSQLMFGDAGTHRAALALLIGV